jgi:hypothetical protein
VQQRGATSPWKPLESTVIGTLDDGQVVESILSADKTKTLCAATPVSGGIQPLHVKRWGKRKPHNIDSIGKGTGPIEHPKEGLSS